MIIDQVKHTFRPEFINRIDEIIVFHPLTTENLSEIAKLLLKAVEKKLEHLHLKMDVSEKARNHLIADGSDFEYGARPLKRTIQKEVEDEISELLKIQLRSEERWIYRICEKFGFPKGSKDDFAAYIADFKKRR